MTLEKALSLVRSAIYECNDVRNFETPMQTEVSKRVNDTRLRLLELLSQAEINLVVDDTKKKVDNILDE